MRHRLHLAAAVLLGALAPAAGRAQAGSCELVESQTFTRQQSGAFAIVSIKGPLLVRCGGGAEIRAMEANLFEATREIHLFGNVEFQDPQRRLTANTAIYTSPTARLHATGNVVFTDLRTRSTLRGPDVEYYRVMPGRPEPQVIAVQRPHLTLVPEARGAEPPVPLEVDGDRIVGIGDNVTVSGAVVIRRPDLTGTSDEARYNRGTGLLELLGAARLDAEEYDLTGEQIEALLPEGGVQRLLARTNARLVGTQMTITAPELQMFFAADRLDRLVARQTAPAPDTRSQPVAVSSGFRLRADSLEAVLPGQRLQQVIAIGRAHAENRDTLPAAASAPRPAPAAAALPAGDSLLALDRDWLQGDTIIGHFVPRDTANPAATADTAVVLKELVARGSAQSLYRVEPKDTTPAPPAPADTVPRPAARRALNFLWGDTITLSFRAGELDVARVAGLKRGLYLDPQPAAPANPEGAPPAGSTPAAVATPRRPEG